MERDLKRSQVDVPERLGVDETSFQKRHEYVTVVNDLEGRVLHVSEGHGKEALREFYEQFEREEWEGVKVPDERLNNRDMKDGFPRLDSPSPVRPERSGVEAYIPASLPRISNTWSGSCPEMEPIPRSRAGITWTSPQMSQSERERRQRGHYPAVCEPRYAVGPQPFRRGLSRGLSWQGRRSDP